MLALVRADECDVAVGSRFLAESGRDGSATAPPPSAWWGPRCCAC